MTLLELIKKASTNHETVVKPQQSNYPIILNPDEALFSLKPQPGKELDPVSLISSVSGFNISRGDTQKIESCSEFYDLLNRKLKDRKGFSSGDFVKSLNLFLGKFGGKVGNYDPSGNGLTCKLIENVGGLMGRDVSRVVIEACIGFEIWDVLEALIVHKVVEHSCYSKVVNGLVEKNKSDLICVCIKHFSDLRSSDLLTILKYFLVSNKDAYTSMLTVKEEWESQALLAIENSTDMSLKTKALRVAKEASILLMISYDGFSVSELCLHYLLASANIDAFILSSAISKLNSNEMMNFIRYLGKWLRKYERFPQAVPCPKASSMLGLKACDWVPKLETIVKCLGLVLDEHFSSLVLHHEYHDELRSINELVSSFALEARLCFSIVNVAKRMEMEDAEDLFCDTYHLHMLCQH